MTIWFGGVGPLLEVLNASHRDSLSGNLGIEFTEVGPDWLRGRMPVDARTVQPYGRLHGGASVAFAETLASMAAAHTIDRRAFGAVGMEINANHVRPVKSGWVTGTATAESIGRTSQVWTIRIEDEAGKLVCLSRMTAAVIALERA
jgi:1,4-dihydroxy-2-naphthoyl-CoA hydrolase